MLVSVHAIRHMAEWRYSSTVSQTHQYKEVSGQLQVLAALLSVKDSRYPLNRMLSGPQNRSEYIAEEKYLKNVIKLGDLHILHMERQGYVSVCTRHKAYGRMEVQLH